MCYNFIYIHPTFLIYHKLLGLFLSFFPLYVIRDYDTYHSYFICTKPDADVPWYVNIYLVLP